MGNADSDAQCTLKFIVTQCIDGPSKNVKVEIKYNVAGYPCFTCFIFTCLNIKCTIMNSMYSIILYIIFNIGES